MIDLYLRATNESALRAALLDAGLAIEHAESGALIAKDCAIDVIGVIQAPTGKMLTVEGVQTPEMKPIAGFHANVRLGTPLSDEQADALADVLIEPPATPARVWA